ncbi:MAG: hypothetical protein GXP62_22130, partial [Oligoflexia bacterium]|nr:hypothetical protein [Oligoflexia bacterium]
VTSRSQARRILNDAKGDYRLFEIGFFEAVALLERIFDANVGQRPAEWKHLLSQVDQGTLNIARKLDPLRVLATELDEDALYCPSPLLDGRWACPFTASDAQLDGFLRKVMNILAGDEDAERQDQRSGVEQVVDDAATACLQGSERQTWVFGLNIVALLASRTGNAEAAAVARATALALLAGRPGQDIPWAREWSSRHLAYATEYAQEVSRQARSPGDS